MFDLLLEAVRLYYQEFRMECKPGEVSKPILLAWVAPAVLLAFVGPCGRKPSLAQELVNGGSATRPH
jgi:hypothetical protein